MKILSKKLNVKYEDNLYIQHYVEKWLGNSQQGKNDGINSKPNQYKKILEDEIELIKKE